MDKNSNKASARPIVKVKDGLLRGRALHTPDGSLYYAFQGIPYAKPPVGELRFKAPQPPEPWSDVRDAGREGNVCMQPLIKVKVQPKSLAMKDMSAFVATVPVLLRRLGKILRQSEDCLYLNVHTPELPQGDNPALRPVLFWIHGGGFMVGDGDRDVFGPDYFLDMGIVVVSFNYRLGPFGFLSVGTEAAPGNAGLKDQALALRWVHDNVAAFGGDPNRVTIYGESAGGASAHLHTLSPLSRGLFHAVIAGSGSALNDWCVTSEQLVRARELGKLLGLETSEPSELAAALRKVSPKRLMHYSTKLRSHQERYIGNGLAFVPVVEPPSPDAFLCEDPETILREGRQAPVPLMMGVNNREGLLWFIGNPSDGGQNPNPVAEMTRVGKRPELFLTDEMHAALTPEQRTQCHKEIVDYYFGEKGVCKENVQKFIDLFGDLMFINPLLNVTRMHAANEDSPVYVYHFGYEGKLGFFKRLLRLKHSGVAHGDELGYLFRCQILPELQLGPENPDLICRNRLLKLWANFIRTGNPTPPESEDEFGVRWTSATASTMDYLDISDTLRMRSEPLTDRVEFWDNLHRRHLGKPLFS